MLSRKIPCAMALVVAVASSTACADGVTTPSLEPSPPAFAAVPSPKSYNAEWAVKYAIENWNRRYGSKASQNPFYDFSDVASGGNCANFASQVVMAGFERTRSARDLFNARSKYLADQGRSSAWYFVSSRDRGPAWAGADEFGRYARVNKTAYRGLHFQWVTDDVHTTFMDYSKVKPGDIISMDYGTRASQGYADGTFDHTMVVTAYDRLRSGYNKIRVTYQGLKNGEITNRGLGDINEQYKYKATFTVWRPVDYSWSGRR
jgi:hypothetical protein